MAYDHSRRYHSFHSSISLRAKHSPLRQLTRSVWRLSIAFRLGADSRCLIGRIAWGFDDARTLLLLTRKSNEKSYTTSPCPFVSPPTPDTPEKRMQCDENENMWKLWALPWHLSKMDFLCLPHSIIFCSSRWTRIAEGRNPWRQQ